MKRVFFATLSALVLNSTLLSLAYAANPPSGDNNPSDQLNPTVDTSTVIDPLAKAGSKPPSGDSNPSDLLNSTVDGGQIINPTPKPQ